MAVVYKRSGNTPILHSPTASSERPLSRPLGVLSTCLAAHMGGFDGLETHPFCRSVLGRELDCYVRCGLENRVATHTAGNGCRGETDI